MPSVGESIVVVLDRNTLESLHPSTVLMGAYDESTMMLMSATEWLGDLDISEDGTFPLAVVAEGGWLDACFEHVKKKSGL